MQQVVCPGCRQTLTLPPQASAGPMACPLCGTAFVPPSPGYNPTLPSMPAGQGFQPQAPPGFQPQSFPGQPISPTVATMPTSMTSATPTVSNSSPRPRRASSQANPMGTMIAIVIGGVIGVAIAGYLIAKTNFVTQVRRDLGMEPSQKNRSTIVQPVDTTVPHEPTNVTSAPPSSHLRPNESPSSVSPEQKAPPKVPGKKSLSELAGGPVPEGTPSDPDEEMEDNWPPRVTFSDLIDPDGKPRPMPTNPQGNPPPRPSSNTPRVEAKGVNLPALDATAPIPLFELSGEEPFAPSRLQLLFSAADLPANAEFALVPNEEKRSSLVTYKAGPESPASEVATIDGSTRKVSFRWEPGNTPDAIREQLSNTIVLYSTNRGVTEVPLRKSQAMDAMAIDAQAERLERTWTIASPPKGSELYLELGDVAAWPHNAEIRGTQPVKLGTRAVIHFRDFAGAQVTIGSTYKKGDFEIAITPEFVERDGDRFSLALPKLDEFVKSWQDVIVRNKEKLAQIETQATATQALIERIEASTATNQAEAAAMVAQKRAAAQKIQGLRSRAASTIKASAQMNARIEAMPKIRSSVEAIHKQRLPSVVVFAKVGNHRIELLRHDP